MARKNFHSTLEFKCPLKDFWSDLYLKNCRTIMIMFINKGSNNHIYIMEITVEILTSDCSDWFTSFIDAIDNFNQQEEYWFKSDFHWQYTTKFSILYLVWLNIPCQVYTLSLCRSHQIFRISYEKSLHSFMYCQNYFVS